MKEIVIEASDFVRAAKEEKIGYNLYNKGECLGELRFYRGSEDEDVEAHDAGDSRYRLVPKTLLGQLFLSILAFGG